MWSRDSVVSIATGLLGGRYGIGIAAGKEIYLRNIRTTSAAHKDFNPTGTGILSGRKAAPVYHLHLLPRLSVSEAKLVLHYVSSRCGQDQF
jgi:hypothetical protein